MMGEACKSYLIECEAKRKQFSILDANWNLKNSMMVVILIEIPV
jgi:hypothetical protein